MFIVLQIIIILVILCLIIYCNKKNRKYKEHFNNTIIEFLKLSNSNVFSSIKNTKKFLNEYKSENKIDYQSILKLNIPFNILNNKDKNLYRIPLLWQCLDTLYKEVNPLKNKIYCQNMSIRTLLESRSSNTKVNNTNEMTNNKCSKNKDNDLQYNIKEGEAFYDGINGLYYTLQLPRTKHKFME